MAMQFPSKPSLPDSPVKLNANENPYGPSKAVRETLKATFDDACGIRSQRYPGSLKCWLKKKGFPQSLSW